MREIQVFFPTGTGKPIVMPETVGVQKGDFVCWHICSADKLQSVDITFDAGSEFFPTEPVKYSYMRNNISDTVALIYGTVPDKGGPYPHKYTIKGVKANGDKSDPNDPVIVSDPPPPAQ